MLSAQVWVEWIKFSYGIISFCMCLLRVLISSCFYAKICNPLKGDVLLLNHHKLFTASRSDSDFCHEGVTEKLLPKYQSSLESSPEYFLMTVCAMIEKCSQNSYRSKGALTCPLICKKIFEIDRILMWSARVPFPQILDLSVPGLWRVKCHSADFSLQSFIKLNLCTCRVLARIKFKRPKKHVATTMTHLLGEIFLVKC
jgi:hypothetical protein